MTALALLLIAFSPPGGAAGAAAGGPDDAWAGRAMPRVTVIGPPQRPNPPRDAKVGVGVTIEPPISGMLLVRVDRPIDGPAGVESLGVGPAGDGTGRGRTERVAAVTVQLRRESSDGPPDRAVATLNLFAPPGGWPAGPATVTVEPEEARHLRVVTPVRFVPESLPAPRADRGIAPAAPPPDRGVLIDLDAPPADPPALEPGERVRVRGTFRRAAFDDPEREWNGVAVEITDAAGTQAGFHYTAALPDRAGDAGGTDFWYLNEIEVPAVPGTYRLRAALPGPPPGEERGEDFEARRTPPVPFTVAPADAANG